MFEVAAQRMDGATERVY